MLITIKGKKRFNLVGMMLRKVKSFDTVHLKICGIIALVFYEGW